MKNTCKICNGETNTYLSWKDYRYKTSDKIYNIIKCSNCKTEQIFPTPTKEEQFTFYPQDYYSYEEEVASKQTRWFLMKLFKNTWSLISSGMIDLMYFLLYWSQYKIDKGWFDTFVENKLNKAAWYDVLDIGCGVGTTQSAFGDKRNRNGFDISDKISKKWSIFYWPSIDTVDFGKQYDAIIAIHVFEHIDEQIQFIKNIHNLFKNDGILLMKLPSCDGIFNTIVGKYAAERDLPRHLFNYSKFWLSRLFENTWFEILDIRYLKNYGTSISIWRYLMDKWIIKNTNSLLFKIISSLLYGIDLVVSFLHLPTNQIGIIAQKIDK